MTRLDLSKFPDFENSQGLLKYKVFREFPDLDKFGEISERIFGCCEFISAKSDEKYPFFSKAVYLRAFLNEFAALNEILKNHSELRFQNISIENTDYPLFHLLKLLRNVNFHVKSFSGKTESYEAMLYDKETNEVYEDVFTFTNFIINEFNYCLVSQARDIKHYDLNEINNVIEWFDNNQKANGVNAILEETLRQFCKLMKSTVVNCK